jgi:hypothetical protein
MLYHRKPMQVDAIKLSQSMTIKGKTGFPGDYLVTFEDGSMSIMSAAVFNQNFVPAQSGALILSEQTPAPEPAKPEPLPTGYICVGCGNESVPEKEFDRNTGQCASCLKEFTTCQTCGLKVQQFEVIGTYCRRCLKK